MTTLFIGDLLNSKANYICHQVNCMGVMGSGVAKQVKERFPKVFGEYSILCRDSAIEKLLGGCQIVPISEKQSFVNLFGQGNYGRDGKQYTDYNAIREAMVSLSYQIKEKESVAFPYKMSSDRGGADWEVIEKMIMEIFHEHDIEIWRLPA
jgi:O-acetyl-ADP-ribose deacetylase (regulator of RNase III)